MKRKGKYHPPTIDPTPEEIAERAAEIRAGWDDQRWEREAWRAGVRDVGVRSLESAIEEHQRGEW